jgi:DNA polymerase-3 subunit gamma/tau
MLDYDYYFKAVNLTITGNIAGSLLLFDEILNNGFEAQHFLLGFAEHLRNLMVCKHPDTLKLLEVAPNVAGKFAQQCQTTSSSFLLNALNLINQTELGYRQSKNQRLHVELTLMKLCNLSRVIQLSTQQPMVDEKKKTNDLIVPSIGISNSPNETANKIAPILSEQNIPNPSAINNLSALEKLKAQVAKNKELQNPGEPIQTDTTSQETNNEEVTLDQFTAIYNIYLNSLETGGKARLAAFLKESPVEWKAPSTAIIELKSEMELEMINEERINFMPLFRSKLNNYQFEIEFTVNKDRIVNLSRISKSDQLKVMIEKQPILGEYVQTLGLEIDY